MAVHRIVVARTCFLFPFSSEGVSAVRRLLLATDAETLPREEGARLNCWRRDSSAHPDEMSSLSPAFRQVIRGSDKAGAVGSAPPWTVERWKLDDACRARLFDGFTKGSEECKFLDQAEGVHEVNLHLYGEMAGVLSLHVNWLPVGACDQEYERDLTSLQTIFRARTEAANEDRKWQSRSGADSACGDCGIPGLEEPRTLLWRILWLLALPESNDVIPTRRGALAMGHTSLLFKTQPDEETLQGCMFSFRRGGDASFLPPGRPAEGDTVVQLRANRWLASAREGSVAMGWLALRADAEFERKWFTERYHGLYLLLAIHAHAEYVTLASLAHEATDKTRMLAPTHAGEGDAHSALSSKDLNDVVELTRKMTRYTVAMVGDDPGGFTDHALFFRATRRNLGTPELLAEVRTELQELTVLVRTEVERSASERDKRFQRDVTRYGVTLSVLGVVTGIGGMNIPPCNPWWWFPTLGILAVVGFGAYTLVGRLQGEI